MLARSEGCPRPMAVVIHGNPLLPAVKHPSPFPPPLSWPSNFPLSFQTRRFANPSIQASALKLEPLVIPISGPTQTPDALAGSRITIPNKDTRSYTAAISSLSMSKRGVDAAMVFLEMLWSGVDPNGYTFVSVLTACSRMNNLELGSQLHGMAMKSGFMGDVYVFNAVMGL